MTIDNYAPCPCGSGKKMKFCKCVDQPQDYEKVMRLIEGEQHLAAMDRVNQLLLKSPSAAWLLALKCELALVLKEVDTFRETVNRFLKLKPDNPLAISMRALVALMDGEPVESAARLLLQGMAESRESLPAVIVDGLMLLVSRLMRSDKPQFRFPWVRMLEQMERTSEGLDISEATGSLPGDSVLAMSPVASLALPAGVPWAERAREVLTLNSGYRYVQAETKLRSILRDFPDQPWLLIQLLEVQILLLEQEGAVATCRKLSTLLELDQTTRDLYAALELELEANRPRLSVPTEVKCYEIESEDAAREELTKLSFLRAWDADSVQQYGKMIASRLINEEVNPRSIYEILERRQTPSGVEYDVPLGNVSLFGRQTDKPPRALVEIIQQPKQPEIATQIASALKTVSVLTDNPGRHLYVMLQLRGRYPVSQEANQSFDLSGAVAEEFLSLGLELLDGITPLQAAEQEPMRARLRALLVHLEAAQDINLSFDELNQIYSRLQIERPTVSAAEIAKNSGVRLMDFMRCDLTQLTDDVLASCFMIAQTFNISRLVRQVQEEVLRRPKSQNLSRFRLLALQLRAQFAQSLEVLLGTLEQLQTELVEQQFPPGDVIMQRIQILVSAGRQEEASAVLEDAIKNHPTDPHVVRFMQMASQSAQARAEGQLNDSQLMSRLGRRGEAPSSSGLVLPGEAEPAAESGRSKLWLPGS